MQSNFEVLCAFGVVWVALKIAREVIMIFETIYTGITIRRKLAKEIISNLDKEING